MKFPLLTPKIGSQETVANALLSQLVLMLFKRYAYNIFVCVKHSILNNSELKWGESIQLYRSNAEYNLGKAESMFLVTIMLL